MAVKYHKYACDLIEKENRGKEGADLLNQTKSAPNVFHEAIHLCKIVNEKCDERAKDNIGDEYYDDKSDHDMEKTSGKRKLKDPSDQSDKKQKKYHR